MKNIKVIIAFVLGILVSGLGVYALNINARDTAYDNTNSGSSATNVQEAIDDLYENGGGKIDLLWTNQTPTSAFSAQTVSLDLSGYDAILLQCVADTAYYQEDFNTVGTALLIQYVKVGSNVSKLGFGSILRAALDPTMYYRSVNVTETGVTFGTGTASTKNSTPSYDLYAVPIRIWGVKKGLEG